MPSMDVIDHHLLPCFLVDLATLLPTACSCFSCAPPYSQLISLSRNSTRLARQIAIHYYTLPDRVRQRVPLRAFTTADIRDWIEDRDCQDIRRSSRILVDGTTIT